MYRFFYKLPVSHFLHLHKKIGNHIKNCTKKIKKMQINVRL